MGHHMKFRSPQLAVVLLGLAMVPGLSWATIDSDGDGVPDDQDECPQTPPKTLVDKHGCALKTDKGVTAAVPVETIAPSVKEPQKSETEFKPPKIAESLPVTAVPMPAPVKPVVAPKAAAASAVVTIAPSEPVQAGEPKKSSRETALSRLARIAEMPATPSKKKHKKPVAKVKSASAAAVVPKAKPSQLSALVEPPEPIVAPPAAPEVMELPRFLVLNFAAGKAELNADSLRKLNALAKAVEQKLADKPALRLEIQAHADAAEGRRPEEVAQDRANMVRVYLDSQGIASSRITLLAAQVDRGGSGEGGRDSRRVEIKILD